MRILGVSLAIAAAGCTADPAAETQVSLDGITYRLPDAHLMSLTQDPHQFVRLHPPGNSFELIYDSRTASQVDASGWPVMFSLNDGRAPDVTRFSQGTNKVVCRQAPSPLGGCGIRVEHRGVKWTVQFPVSQAQTATTVYYRALAELATYAS